MRQLHLFWFTTCFVCWLGACGDDGAARPQHDAGANHPDSAVSLHDAADGCSGTLCGECYPALSLQITGSGNQPVQAWSAHITGHVAGKDTDCVANGPADACLFDLKPGTYDLALTIEGVPTGSRKFTIEPSNAGPQACCDCGYLPLTLDLGFEILCGAGADGGVEDGGASDADGGLCGAVHPR